MRVYLRDASAQTIKRAATLRQKLQTKLSISPSHSILTPGQPVPAVTSGAWQGSHWSANVLCHWYDTTPTKSWRKRYLNSRSAVLKADASTTRPMSQYRWREKDQGTLQHCYITALIRNAWFGFTVNTNSDSESPTVIVTLR